jgi:transcriptional regulator with XRE-family HTH domain
MSDTTDALRHELRDLEYAEGYSESFINSYIATQIKVLREQRDMKQADLAAEMGTSQAAISRIENVNYSSWSISTLKKIARALKVRLHVSFETYGSLIDEVDRFNRDSLQREPQDKDPSLWEETKPAVAEQAVYRFVQAVGVGGEPYALRQPAQVIDISSRFARVGGVDPGPSGLLTAATHGLVSDVDRKHMSTAESIQGTDALMADSVVS